MSRAYRIRVKESISLDVDAHDEICSDLEILEILPAETMSDLLAKELSQRGYVEEDGNLTKKVGSVVVTVDPLQGTVSVRNESSEHVDLQVETSGTAYDDVGPAAEKIREGLQKAAKEELERKKANKQEKLQREVSQQLEGALADVRKELNEAINAITREALKQKAAQMGAIKEMSEDPAAGTLTIKVEV